MTDFAQAKSTETCRTTLPMVAGMVNATSLRSRLRMCRGAMSLDVLLALALEIGDSWSDLLQPARFDDAHSCGCTIALDNWCEVQVVGWRRGQFSTMHGHGDSNCVIVVLRGVLSSTVRTPLGGHEFVESSRTLLAGQIDTASGEQQHRLGNASPQDLITLHIYSPALARPRDRRSKATVSFAEETTS